jgi:hypothetical protein
MWVYEEIVIRQENQMGSYKVYRSKDDGNPTTPQTDALAGCELGIAITAVDLAELNAAEQAEM